MKCTCISEKIKMELLKLRKRKGISPLIATLLLIAIAVAASVLTYSWVMSMIGSQSAQAQTQVRIDSVTWGTDNNTFTSLDVRNTGSVDAILESVSIRKNVAGSQSYVASVSNAIATGGHLEIILGSGADWAPTSGPGWWYSASYVVRVTTNTGFYYEAVFTSPAKP
jgi:flagellin-like protein